MEELSIQAKKKETNASDSLTVCTCMHVYTSMYMYIVDIITCMYVHVCVYT